MDSVTNFWTFFVYVFLPYITVMVFIWGLFYRIRRWLRLPRAKAVVYPAASSSFETVGKVAWDIVLFGKTFKGSKGLWAMTYLFHMSLALIVLGHVRTVTEVPWFWNLFGIGETRIQDISFLLGATAGLAMFAGAFLLLVRRFTPSMRRLSLFEDYFLLALLLAIIGIGNYMRLFSPVNLEEIRQYAIGVLTFQPAVTVNNPLFLWHFFLAQVLIMYFPFSKLIHVISKAITDSWTVR